MCLDSGLLPVQYSSVLFPGVSRMASVTGGDEEGWSLLRPKRTDFQATVAVFSLP